MSSAYSDLIDWADSANTERDALFLDRWLASFEDKNRAVDDLALYLAKGYVNGQLSFDIASTLFNQVMPVIGFDEAPSLFWRFYSAFEDYEVLEEPDVDATARIQRELSTLNEI